MNQIVLSDADFQRLGMLSGDQLARLFRFLTDRCSHIPMDRPNQNVLSVRVPPATVTHVQALAVRHGTTRSRILQEAVAEYARRNPV